MTDTPMPYPTLPIPLQITGNVVATMSYPSTYSQIMLPMGFALVVILFVQIIVFVLSEIPVSNVFQKLQDTIILAVFVIVECLFTLDNSNGVYMVFIIWIFWNVLERVLDFIKTIGKTQ